MEGYDGRGGGCDSNLMRSFSRGLKIKSLKQNYHTCLLLLRYYVSHSSRVIIRQLQAHFLGISCQWKWKEDETDSSSRIVERLLRHKENIIYMDGLAQRVAKLNTKALQQLHSYLVSTMQWIYERQLISDTFAIDDAFVERDFNVQKDDDWFMTGFKAMNTQNVTIFHEINNEDSILDWLIDTTN